MPDRTMTVAEARDAGLLDGSPKRKTTRKTAPRAGAVSECNTCHEQFTTDAAETRHLNDTGHPRYITPHLEGSTP